MYHVSDTQVEKPNTKKEIKRVSFYISEKNLISFLATSVQTYSSYLSAILHGSKNLPQSSFS